MPELQIETEDGTCWSAIKEAADVLQEKCGKASNIILDGEKITLTIPPEIKEITARNGLTHEEMIESIIRSDWGKNTAHGMCQKLFGAEPDTPEYNACFQRVARKLAEGMFE